MRGLVAFILLPACINALAAQTPLELQPVLVPNSPIARLRNISTDSKTANFVFNGLASLLQLFPNAIHQNGHTICPAIIRAHTPLYHARHEDRPTPPSPEWLAFDPEMSYAIMAGTSSSDTFLWTYTASRDLRVLYFDGMSAALGDTGMLDTQEVLLARRGGVVGGRGWFDDYERLRSLCVWAKDKGVDGFVRMNTGFELMWCEFDVGLNLVSRLNITPPDTVRIDRPRLRRREEILRVAIEDPPLSYRETHIDPPAPPRMPPGWRRAPLTRSSWFEWLRVASHRAFSPQPNVRLITSGLVTFYDPSFTSLLTARQKQTMHEHRVWNISTEDAARAADQVEAVLQREGLWTSDGVQWDAITRRMVENWGDRIAQMNATLQANLANPVQAIDHICLLSYSLLNPYLDTTFLPFANSSDPELWLPLTVDRCISAYTVFIPIRSLTPEERLLKASIDTVASRLCHYAGGVLASALGAESTQALVEEIANTTSQLIDWLDWPMWTRCDENCGWNAVCTVPLWPIMRPRQGKPQARCVETTRIL